MKKSISQIENLIEDYSLLLSSLNNQAGRTYWE